LANFTIMKKRSSKLLIGITSILLIGLLVNQVLYAYNSAGEQKIAFDTQAAIALDVIVDEISENRQVCKSVKTCLIKEKNNFCCTVLNTEKEWQSVDSIIQNELARFNINLNYNFDFCKNQINGPNGQNSKHTFTKNMDKVFEEAGVIMYIEFPGKSKYLFNQMGPIFISSILLILFITIAFIITFRYYKREKGIAKKAREFINNMTHEFKTPLANISFANNMIARHQDVVSSEKIQQYSRIIKEENERLVDNCEDLLTMASSENNLDSEFTEQVNAKEVMESVLENFRIMHDSKNLSIDLNWSAQDNVIISRQSFLYNSFSNLVDNAIKYSGDKVDIAVSANNKNGMLVVEVQDHGIGISKDHLNNIFEEFYRVTKGDQYQVKGFGLGLTYVKMVIGRMKGSISVKSNLGIGSTFIIKLPLISEK
jgi:two-component system phosphate regulon sensor histidine kinase PhoR